MLRSMTGAAPLETMSYAEYLQLEARTGLRHEYLRGEAFAMTGGSVRHAQLASNLFLALGRLVAGQPCQVFGSDLKIRHEDNEFASYPDLSVVCRELERAPDDPNAVRNPVLIVEVLSESTEGRDRGVKAAHYRRIPALREYLLVSQAEPRLELYRRNAADRWELYEAGPGESLELESVAGRITVDEVYRDPLATTN